MSDTRVSPHRLCPHCGASISPAAERCFLCLVKLGPPPDSGELPTREWPPSVTLQRSDPAIAVFLWVVLVLTLLAGTASMLPLITGYAGFLIVLVLVAVPVLVYFRYRPGDRRPAPALSP